MANEQQIWDFLKSKHFNDYAAAAIMGVLFAQSLLRPNNLEDTGAKKLKVTDDAYTKAVDSNKYTHFTSDNYGYGLAQWHTKADKTALLNAARVAGASISDLSLQLGFLYNQLCTKFNVAMGRLQKAKSVDEAVEAFLSKYFGVKLTNKAIVDARIRYAQKYYDKYHVEVIVPTVKMKYSAAKPPLYCPMTQSTWYQQAVTMDVLGVQWHSTGANNPTLKRYVQPDDNASNKAAMLELLGINKYLNDYNHIYATKGHQAYVGKLADGSITSVNVGQWNKRSWGCGSGKNGSCNDGWISFEICEDGLTDVDYFNAVYEEACQLTAYLCLMFNIDPLGKVSKAGLQVPTIVCHAETYTYGMGSNHGDVIHWFKKYGKTMDDVRNYVAELVASADKPIPAPAPAEFTPYIIKVNTATLNVRKEPTTNSDIVMQIHQGEPYTIVEERNGWGKLKSGAGWISLKYTLKK